MSLMKRLMLRRSLIEGLVSVLGCPNAAGFLCGNLLKSVSRAPSRKIFIVLTARAHVFGVPCMHQSRAQTFPNMDPDLPCKTLKLTVRKNIWHEEDNKP